MVPSIRYFLSRLDGGLQGSGYFEWLYSSKVYPIHFCMKGWWVREDSDWYDCSKNSCDILMNWLMCLDNVLSEKTKS